MKLYHQSFTNHWTVVPKEYYIDGLVSLIHVTKMIYRGFKNDIQNIYKSLGIPIRESAADLLSVPTPETKIVTRSIKVLHISNTQIIRNT